GQMEYTYFPVTLDQLGAAIQYHDLSEETFYIDDVKVTTHYLNHPARTLGYRIEVGGRVLVYSADHEPHSRHQAEPPAPDSSSERWTGGPICRCRPPRRAASSVSRRSASPLMRIISRPCSWWTMIPACSRHWRFYWKPRVIDP